MSAIPPASADALSPNAVPAMQPASVRPVHSRVPALSGKETAHHACVPRPYAA